MYYNVFMLIFKTYFLLLFPVSDHIPNAVEDFLQIFCYHGFI